MTEKRVTLSIDEVELDNENPRIKGALEKYGDDITDERIHFALQNSADDGAKNASGFHRLKISIKASDGIEEPIKVVKQNEHYICIDGNTRLAIYRDFAKDNEKWKTIPAIVLEDASQRDIEKIRITTHLVGARPWPAYEKAQYLKNLRYEKLMDYDDIIALCGGNRSEIEQQIDAFEDMNKYYRDKVGDSEFRIDRFSGFVEAQKRVVREAILETYGMSDFGDWIHEGKIKNLRDVRLLPKVLRDEEAREFFVSGGINSIKAANKIIDDRSSLISENQNLQKASIDQLAITLRTRLEDMPVSELGKLRDSEEIQSTIENLRDQLTETLEYVRK